jgi:hypothetical protein
VVYPVTGLPLVVQIAPGASSAGSPGDWPWTDVTYAARLADGITISEGQGDWGSKVDPGSIALTFDNRTGDFSEWNPLGQWYGLLGRDTPLRVRLRRGEDTFARTVSNGLGTADSGQAWTPLSPASAWSVGSGHGTCSISAVNSIRRILFGATLLDCEQRISLTPSLALTGGSLVWRTIFRYQDSSNYYCMSVELDRNTGSGLTVTCKIRRLQGASEQELVVASPVPGLLYTAGQPVHMRAGIAGQTLGVKAWVGTLADEPAGWSCEIVDYAHTVPGLVGQEVYLAFGNTNTLPYTVQLDDYQLDVDLAGGYVPAWVPRWDKSGNDRTVPVVAKGVLYRAQPATGKPPPRSPMRRTIAASGPVAYIPLESGTAGVQGGSAVSGSTPATTSGTVTFDPIGEFYTTSLYSYVRPGMTALANITSGGQLFATLPAAATAATMSAWVVHSWALFDPTTLSGDFVILEWTTPGGTYARWQLIVTTASHTKVIGYSSAGAATTLIDLNGAYPSGSAPQVIAYQSGGNIAVELWGRGSVDLTTSVAGTLTGVATLAGNTTGVTATVQTALGQWAVWAASAPQYRAGSASTDFYGVSVPSVANSFPLEAATERIQRLVAEDGITFNLPKSPSTEAVVRMIYQPVGIPRDLYQQCVDADGGILYEQPFRLEYITREQLYNQVPALTLTKDQLGTEPAPDLADQAYRNRIEVKRIDGASAIAEAPEVAAGAIVYDDSAELSLADDSQTPNQAGWRLHLAASRGLRWPKLDIDFAAEPGLIDQWLCCRPGSRVTVTNPPQDVAGQDIDVLLLGAETKLGYKDFDVSANFSPAQVWDVATVDGDQRVAADGSTVNTTLASGGTSLSLASTTANGPWTTAVANYPADFRVGGERTTAASNTGASSPQTAAITRNVNGVTRAWPAGTEVDVWRPAIVAL